MSGRPSGTTRKRIPRTIPGLLAGGMLLVSAPLAAQENRPWQERVFVTVEVPVQTLSNSFSEALTFADSIRRSENVAFGVEYPSARAVLVDVGTGIRVAKSLGVGISASWSRRSTAASFDLKMPNPLAANSPLEVAGSVADLTRQEAGVHIDALYALPVGRHTRVMVSAGPSIFHVKHDLIRSVRFDVLPGFTSLKFDEAVVARVERTVVGFNAGADLTWAIVRHLAIGAATRYSRANVTLDPGSQSGVARAIESRAGGLQIGGGVQLRF
jgi:hypothetical protein